MALRGHVIDQASLILTEVVKETLQIAECSGLAEVNNRALANEAILFHGFLQHLFALSTVRASPSNLPKILNSRGCYITILAKRGTNTLNGLKPDREDSLFKYEQRNVIHDSSGSVKCQGCGIDVPEENCFISEGRTLCEDCYIEAGQTPGGERSKMIFRESHGLTGTEGLTDLQKRIYEFVKIKEKVTREDLAREFGRKPGELENEFAILRHCQLLKGKKEGDKVYLVLW